MLLGNYSVLNRNPLRYLGGGTATPEVNHHGAMLRGGARKNRQYVEETMTANKQFSLPYGSYPSYTTLMPQVGGELSARRSADFSVDAFATGGRGMPAVGAASISVDFNVPSAELIAFGIGSASVDVATNAPLLTASINGSGFASASLTPFPAPVLGALANLAASAGLSLSASGTILPENDDPVLRTGSATLTVNGTLIPYAIGNMIGNALPYTELSPQSLANAVWTQVIEAGYSAEQIVRILAAHAAGAATNLEGSNPQFIGLDGSTIRIDGTYSAGNRTIDALNGD